MRREAIQFGVLLVNPRSGEVTGPDGRSTRLTKASLTALLSLEPNQTLPTTEFIERFNRTRSLDRLIKHEASVDWGAVVRGRFRSNSFSDRMAAQVTISRLRIALAEIGQDHLIQTRGRKKGYYFGSDSTTEQK